MSEEIYERVLRISDTEAPRIGPELPRFRLSTQPGALGLSIGRYRHHRSWLDAGGMCVGATTKCALLFHYRLRCGRHRLVKTLCLYRSPHNVFTAASPGADDDDSAHR